MGAPQVVVEPRVPSSNKEEMIEDTSPPITQLRKIEFHLARNPFSSLPNTNSNFKLQTLNPSVSSSHPSPTLPSSSSSKKPQPSNLLDSALDPYLTFRISFRRIGAGLENLGNTCFLNSVLQCLTYTEPLVAYLQSGKHQTTCHVAGFCALCAIQKHVTRALQSTGRILSPKDLVSNLRCISRNFRNSRQEDAHEYMIHLLESMHKCCLPSGVPAESPSAYEKSWVHKIFGGRLRSQVKCLQCSYCSNTFDPFLDLSLEIVKADSLCKALMHFTAAEQLDGGERQYKCERCKQKVRALKQLTIYTAPFVLTVHLKRFRSHFSGQKIDKKVHFGSTLDLKPFVSGAYEGDLKYTLYGVLVHAGWSTHSGHYYCFVRTSSGLWYSLDDNRVFQVSERTVLEQKAYMLFYVRDRKNFAPKKAMDAVHKENLITTMRTASSSTSIIKACQNGYADKSSRDQIPSNLFVKHFNGTNAYVVGTAADPKVQGPVTGGKNDGKLENIVPLKSSIQVNGETGENDGKLLKSCPPKSTIEVNSESGENGGKLEENGSSKSKILVNNECGEYGGKLEKIGPSNSEVPISSGSEICKEEAVEPISDTHTILSESRNKRPSVNVSFPAKMSECTLRQKKISKSRVGGMRLSTNLLFGTSLILRKRKKSRRLKQGKENVLQEHLLAKDVATTDMGPSASDRISGSVGSIVGSCKSSNACPTKGEKDAAKNIATGCKGTSSIVNTDVGLKDRIACSDAVLATGDSCHSEKLNSQLQTGVISALTSGLEERAVAHWEGIDSPSELVESNGQHNLSIGYVPDEWDEEYDRGKRKKVRGPRNDFGGPNVFQEIATKKAKLKGQANKQRNHGNQPFRI